MRIGLQSMAEAQQLFGNQDSFLRMIEGRFKARVMLRSDHLEVVGEPQAVHDVSEVLNTLLERVRAGQRLRAAEVKATIRDVRHHRPGVSSREAEELPSPFALSPEEGGLDVLPIHSRHGPIRPRSKRQAEYIEAIRTHDLVFGVGPAGTGKTYLAMAMAASALKSGLVDRIIMTRPAVEAGEKLGFLPGDIQAKVDPYLRPLYDALYDMFPPRTIQQFMDRGQIEIAPLAFMRGRTLNRAFVVLDEAQNATIAQMKMFLTRLGFDSKAVITGDASQSDLDRDEPSGLVHAVEILRGIEGIAIVEFQSSDVVRHALVQRIIEAYDQDAARREQHHRSTEKQPPTARASSSEGGS